MDSRREALVRVAMRNHGVITRREALACGYSEKAIEARLHRDWIVLHPGIYRLREHPRSWEQDVFAACRWSKDGVASHRAAGALFALPGCDRPPVEITVRRCHLQPRAGITLHHSDKLPLDQVAERSRIPCTSIERTLLDLGAVWPRIRVAAALDDALRRGLTTVAETDRCLGAVAKRGRRGCKNLRELLRERWLLTTTPHSPLETRLFELFARSGLLLPELQYEIFDGSRFIARVDFCYPTARLIIEADSWKHHSGRSDWSRDIERTNQLLALGWKVLRVTWSDVVEFPDRTLQRIVKILGAPNFT